MEPIILHVDTATSVCSVALSINAKIVSEKIEQKSNQHTRLINVFIRDILIEAKLSIKELHAISLTIGPGSYTGLRVGMSAVKGLCYGGDIPMITIGTLEALAQPFLHSNKILIPTIDARRNEVYTAQYNETGFCLIEPYCLVVEPQTYPNLWPPSEDIIICGNGANKLSELLNSYSFQLENNISLASYQAKLALKKYLLEDFSDIFLSKPNYLKPPNITKPRNKALPPQKS